MLEGPAHRLGTLPASGPSRASTPGPFREVAGLRHAETVLIGLLPEELQPSTQEHQQGHNARGYEASQPSAVGTRRDRAL